MSKKKNMSTEKCEILKWLSTDFLNTYSEFKEYRQISFDIQSKFQLMLLHFNYRNSSKQSKHSESHK